MVLFSVIVLVIILFILQHLLNWAWRNTDNESAFGFTMLLFIIFVLSWILIEYIIIWGQELI